MIMRVENEWKGPNLWVAAALSPEKNNGPTHYNMCRLVMKKNYLTLNVVNNFLTYMILNLCPCYD